MLYYLINWKTENYDFLRQYKDFFKLLINNPKFKFIENLNIEQTIDFLKSKINEKEECKIIFPFICTIININSYTEKMIKIINLIDHINIPDNIQIYFFTTDPWINKNNKNYLQLLYNSNKINVIITILDIDDFKIHKDNIHTPIIKNKNILCYNLNHLFTDAIININNSPINKIALSGDNKKTGYPGRNKFHRIMTKYPDKYKRLKKIESEYSQKNNNFNMRLHKYLCNYYDGVFNYNHSIPLMKIFEILGSGSLLVYNINQQPIFDKFKLIDGIHCMSININNKRSLIRKIDYILHPDNRNIIDKIRKQGQQYAIKNFSAKQKYEEFLSIIK